jgi:sulfite exporter TauE/SafE
MFLLAAISMGFFGSFHCIGMCGPIALAIPMYNKNKFYKTASILMYNAGRIFTYSSLGILFGLIGQGFALAGLQQILSVTLGSIILLIVLLPQHLVSKYRFTNILFKLVGKVKTALAKQLAKKGLLSLFVLGTLNGLLPCGLVYMAIAGAVASSSVLHAVLFMAFFGLATVPLMFSISYFSHLISLQFRSTIRKTIPYITAAMAILLIVRGLNLNIPYLSPEKNAETNSFASCHHTKSPTHMPRLCVGK